MSLPEGVQPLNTNFIGPINWWNNSTSSNFIGPMNWNDMQTFKFNNSYNFDNGFNFNNNFTFGSAISPNTTTSIASSNTSSLSLADKMKKWEEYGKKISEAEENLKTAQKEAKDLSEIYVDTVAEVKDEQTGEKKEVNTVAKKETMEEYKALPWWKKTLRAGSSMLAGCWNVAKSFAGFEKDPKTGKSKWNPLKCLRNVAIGAACVAICSIPGVGPVATAALVTTGVVSGAIGVSKGISKVCNAQTPEEIDEGYEDFGAGLCVTITSALGLKGLGKSAAMTTRSMGNNAVSQFAKDATVNAYRATVQNISAGKQAAASNGFFKQWGTNIKNTANPLAGKGKQRFEAQKDQANKDIEARISDINTKLNTATDNEKILLRQEKNFLEAQIEEYNAVSKTSWKEIAKNSKSEQEIKMLEEALAKLNTNGSVEINGVSITKTDANVEALTNMIKNAKNQSKVTENIVKTKYKSMKYEYFKGLKNKDTMAEVKAYTGKNSFFGNTWNALSAYSTKNNVGMFIAKGLQLSMPEFAIYNVLKCTPWLYGQYAMSAFETNFHEEQNMLAMFVGGQPITLTDEKGNPIQTTKKECIEKANSDITTMEEEIRKAKEEQRKIFIG